LFGEGKTSAVSQFGLLGARITEFLLMRNVNAPRAIMQYNMVRDAVGLGTKNYYAREGQKDFKRPIEVPLREVHLVLS
jgi:hypothetical protein